MKATLQFIINFTYDPEGNRIQVTNDRVIDYQYDFRNRRIQSQTSDGTTLFITRIVFDNVDNPLSETGYHTSTVAGNRISHRETMFDLRNRVFEEKTYGVDPANGNLTEALTAGIWYDEDSNVIKQTRAGQKGAIKVDYDGLNLPVNTYTVVPGTPPSGAPANDVSDDIVVEQSVVTYNEANLLITSAVKQRLPEATGKGPLGGATGTQPRARVSWICAYFDAMGRNRFLANYGTNGGAAVIRPDIPAAPSEIILVTETRYNPAGYSDENVATDGVINRTAFDQLGRFTETIEAFGTVDARTQGFRWHASGQMEYLILENPDTGQQVTRWIFGSTLASSDVARNDVIVGKQYPTGESASYIVNRQSEIKGEVQPNGTSHEYNRNQVGQILHDAVITFGTGIDNLVRRISTAYNNRGLQETVTSWNNATPGSGTVDNEVKFSYDAFNQVITDEQEHSGAVDGSTPAVGYAFTAGSGNTLRLTSVTTPSGIQTNRAYGVAGSIDDFFNRPASLSVDGESGNLVEYQYAGLSMSAKVLYPTPNAELSYLATAASGTGDGGDSLIGYDRFNRVIKMPWKNKSNNSFLAQIAYGYDAASRRKWRQDLTPASDREQDRYYTYDHLSQVKTASVGTLNDNRTAIGGIPGQAEAWNYDETGNWLAYQKAAEGVTTIDETRTNNQSNQITQIDGLSAGIAYDLNGNTILLPSGDGLQGPSRTLKWDAWNRLVEVRNAETDTLVARYTYDGLFRRTTVTDANSSVTHWYYNNKWRVVEDRIGTSSNPSQVYYWGTKTRWELIRRDRDTDGNGTLDETLYCLTDAMDPIAIVNASGTLVERYDYTAFGGVGILTPDYTVRAESGFAWAFLFHREFRDADTRMYNYGYRYFDPQTGKWMSRDPIAEKGGVNLYEFVGNNSFIKIDILGLAENCVTFNFTTKNQKDNAKQWDRDGLGQNDPDGDGMDVTHAYSDFTQGDGSLFDPHEMGGYYPNWDTTNPNNPVPRPRKGEGLITYECCCLKDSEKAEIERLKSQMKDDGGMEGYPDGYSGRMSPNACGTNALHRARGACGIPGPKDVSDFGPFDPNKEEDTPEIALRAVENNEKCKRK